MTTEFPSALSFEGNRATLHFDKKSYLLGKLHSVFIMEDGSCSINYGTIRLSAEKSKEFVRDFLRTWDLHQIPLTASLEAVDYNPDQAPPWSLRFTREVGSVKELLTDYANGAGSFEAQIECIRDLTQRIMGRQWSLNTDLTKVWDLSPDLRELCLPRLKDSPQTIELLPPTDRLVATPYDPLAYESYTIDDAGVLTRKDYLYSLAERLEQDPDATAQIRNCAEVFKELSGQLPLQAQTIETLKNLIAGATLKELSLLCTHLNLSQSNLGVVLGTVIEARLQKQRLREQGLLGIDPS